MRLLPHSPLLLLLLLLPRLHARLARGRTARKAWDWSGAVLHLISARVGDDLLIPCRARAANRNMRVWVKLRDRDFRSAALLRPEDRWCVRIDRPLEHKVVYGNDESTCVALPRQRLDCCLTGQLYARALVGRFLSAPEFRLEMRRAAPLDSGVYACLADSRLLTDVYVLTVTA